MSTDRAFCLGLTGSIGMGKTTTAAMFHDAGIPSWDADATVHSLYRKGGAAVPGIAELVPQAIVDDAVDRNTLRQAFFSDPGLPAKVEATVHPLVAESRKSFIDSHPGRLVLLDIPLLFETGGEACCDAVVVVTARPEIQAARVLARPGMTQESFDAILSRQLPDAEKRERADYIVDTSEGLEDARRQVHLIVEDLKKAGHA